jgi:glycerol-3-phosphate O-acyltransferase / dihydroxyacetone phosphate acyltransferase
VRFHAERVPISGPVLFTSNHPNSLTDAFVIGASVPRKVHFVATVQLFRFRAARWLLLQAGVIPINRAKDDPRAMRSVMDSFEACFRVLEKGEAVGIFPEGITHDDPQLKAVKTGAARMALELEHRHGGSLGLHIVPVGLTFSDKVNYRSEVLVHFGEPLRVSDFLRDYPAKRHECIHALSADIEQRIKGLILHIPKLERFRIVRAVRRLYQDRITVAQRVLAHAAPVPVEEIHQTRTIARVVDFAFEHRPERAAAFVLRLDHYERLLGKLRLSDEDLALLPQGRERWQQSAVWVCMALVGAPLALYGWLHRWLPVRAIDSCKRSVSKRDPRPTSVSTAVILTGIAAFVVFYGIFVGIFHLFFGWPASLFYALSLPPAGLLAHYYVRELRRFRASLRATWLQLRAPAATRRLLEMRAHLIADIEKQKQEIFGRIRSKETSAPS